MNRQNARPWQSSRLSFALIAFLILQVLLPSLIHAQTEFAGQGIYRHLLWENAHTGDQAAMLAVTGWTEESEVNRLLINSPRWT